MDDLDWDRVAEAVRDRVSRLGMTQAAIAEASGVSPMTLRKLMGAKQDSYRQQTLSAVSIALGWGHDGIERIGRGEDPEAVEAATAESGEDVLGLFREILARLDEIADRLDGQGGFG